MENDIQVFSHEMFGSIRVVMIDSRPAFTARDVCVCLGYPPTRVSQVLQAFCKGVTESIIPSAGGPQRTKVIFEPDLYRLVLKSKAADAELFQDWVVEEVLPSIRKSGGYIVAKRDENPEEILARAVLVANDTIERLKSRIEQAKPKELFADCVAASDCSILVGDLAKMIKQNGVDTGQRRMFNWLRDNDWLMKGGESKNMPTQKSMNMGLFEIKEQVINKPDGTVVVTKTPKVTGKGQIYFINKFCGNN